MKPAAVFGLLALTAFQMPSAAAPAAPSLWQRVTFAPLPIPGTTEHMDVRVSQEVIVGTGNSSEYRPIGTAGTIEPSFLRFDLEWSARDDAQCKPVPKPAPIANGTNIYIALHHGDAVVTAKPMDWIGVGNACGTTWFRTEFFPTEAIGLDQIWFEVRAAGRTYWVELPYGLGGRASIAAVNERARREAVLPPYLSTLTEKDILVPWATVRYPIEGGGFLDMVDGCDGVARVTLSEPSPSPIDRPSITIEIHRADGSVFKGREISRSIGPRQSVFDFRSRSGTLTRTWDAIEIRVNDARMSVTVPSSLYLLGLRLANWGDLHRLPVPDVSCKD